MDNDVKVLMGILKSEISDYKFDYSLFSELSEESQLNIVKIARKHSVVQLLGDALGKSPETKNLAITKELFLDTVLTLKHVNEIEKERISICKALDEAKIAYIQLKGSRVRQYYPEPWMRNSCDIDILIHESEVEKAADILCNTLGYKVDFKNYHDISMYSPSGVHLELHFNIKENMTSMDTVLLQVWDYSYPSDDADKSEYLQSNEFFMFHLIAHMAYHFVSGGCGIRAVLDLFLMQEKFSYDDSKVIELCEKAQLNNFYANIKDLIDVWFGNKAHSEVTGRMESYIISGGTFGTVKNKIAVEQNKYDNKSGYIRHRIFMPTRDLCKKYPSLEKNKWLMPLYQLRRWSSLINIKKSKKAISDMKICNSIDDETALNINKMLKDNGL